MNVIINVNKPQGMTSFGAVRAIKKLCQTKKVGHLGTLDPLATGVLPIFVGKATKLIPWFNGLDKEYRATFKLGERTDTYDSEGEVIAQTELGTLSTEAVEACVAKFQGVQKQLAPAYSAVKYNGVPGYRLARQGKTVERKERTISIHAITVESIEFPFVTIRVHCSKGTYIRSLVDDIGQILEVGAHMSALERLAAGKQFTLDNAFTLPKISELQEQGDFSYELNPALLLSDFVSIEVDGNEQKRLSHGQSIVVAAPAAPLPEGQEHAESMAKVLDSQKKLIAIGQIVAQKENFQFKPTSIFV